MSSTETAPPVSIKQCVGLPFIHTSTVSSPGGRSLVELAAVSVIQGAGGCPLVGAGPLTPALGGVDWLPCVALVAA